MIIDFSLWSWPQWTMVAIWTVSIIGNVLFYTQSKKGRLDLICQLVMLLIYTFILIKGGFFK